MNRSTKYNFYLPQNTDPIDVSNFNDNFEIIDDNLITQEQSFTSTQKETARGNLDLGGAALQDVANNLTTTSEGSVLDARQGKALNDKATANGNSVSAIQDSIAIVSTGNTHIAITSGQYVYVRNHSSLSEGLYTAISNISANATLSTSNLLSVSQGGLNSLYNRLIPIYIKTVTGTTTGTGAITPNIDISTYFILGAAFTSDNASTGFVFWRGKDGYLHCFDTSMTAMANTSVKLQVVYCKRSNLTAV